ncbi:MAG: hypothetical protein ACREMY_03510 [bacterium]
MSDHEPTAARLSALLDEYKELGADIRERVDLQQRNANLLLVFITASTGYLFNYWKDHGVHHGAASLVHSDIAALVPAVALVANVFVWRHLDHDQNIIDKATYIDTVLRPAARVCAGGEPVLGWEEFQRERRRRRPLRLGPLALLGNEHVPMMLLVISYLAAGWYIRLSVSHPAGEAHRLFDYLLYVGTGVFAASVWMSVVTAFDYGKLGRQPVQDRPAQPRRRRGVRRGSGHQTAHAAKHAGPDVNGPESAAKTSSRGR